jgi:hypothetical protein
VSPTQAPHSCRLDGDVDRCEPCQQAPSVSALSKAVRIMDALGAVKCSKRAPCDEGEPCFSHRMALARWQAAEGKR